MSKPSQTKPNLANFIFDSPVKTTTKSRQLLLTNHETYEKSNQKSIQSSHSIQTNPNTMNIFRNKKYTRSIKKTTLKLLAQEAAKLHVMKTNAQTSSDSPIDSYKQELDKVYVIVARIENVHQDKKYYTIYCQDDGIKEFKLYFLKNLTNSDTKDSSDTKRRIKNLDSLQFEQKLGEGTPYFKFFLIFREIPIFEKGDNQILSSEDNSSQKESEDFSFRKKYQPKIKTTDFRIYVEHFEKIENFNYLPYHNMSVVFEELCSQKTK